MYSLVLTCHGDLLCWHILNTCLASQTNTQGWNDLEGGKGKIGRQGQGALYKGRREPGGGQAGEFQALLHPTSAGQFHDALAELLQWIGTESSALTTAPPPGVEEETINRKIQDLEVGGAHI